MTEMTTVATLKPNDPYNPPPSHPPPRRGALAPAPPPTHEDAQQDGNDRDDHRCHVEPEGLLHTKHHHQRQHHNGGQGNGVDDEGRGFALTRRHTELKAA